MIMRADTMWNDLRRGSGGLACWPDEHEVKIMVNKSMNKSNLKFLILFIMNMPPEVVQADGHQQGQVNPGYASARVR